MGSHDGHRQRLKQQFLLSGAESFADHQLLELLLFYAIPRRDTNETAHLLLEKFGSLQGVLFSSPDELAGVEGVGENAALLLRLAGDLSICAQKSKSKTRLLNTTALAGAYFVEILAGQKRELLYEACLDAKCKLISCRCISKGTVTSAPVQVRQVVETALYAGADSILLAHNHPGGVALPSQGDIISTRLIQQALKPLGILLRDHIIVSDGEFTSLAKSGGMPFEC